MKLYLEDQGTLAIVEVTIAISTYNLNWGTHNPTY